MADRTHWYMLGMVTAVALAGLLLLAFQPSGNSSNAITGMVALESSEGSLPSDVPIASSEPTPEARGFTVISVSLLLGIAAYLYFHPEYNQPGQ